jgi:hypothetical protein
MSLDQCSGSLVCIYPLSWNHETNLNININSMQLTVRLKVKLTELCIIVIVDRELSVGESTGSVWGS